jgi:porin
MTNGWVGFTKWARTFSGLLIAAVAVFGSRSGQTAPPTIQIPTEETFEPSGPVSAGPFSFLNGISRSGFMLGDMWGLRTALAQYGISFALQETSEVLGNVTGGAKQGAAYDGLTQMALQLDTNRAFGLHGGLFNVSAL